MLGWFPVASDICLGVKGGHGLLNCQEHLRWPLLILPPIPTLNFKKKNGFLWRSLLFIRDSENRAECRRLTSGSDICLHSFHQLGLPSVSVGWTVRPRIPRPVSAGCGKCSVI